MTELLKWSCFNYHTLPDIFNPVNLQLAGYIFGDPRFEDGTYIVTSRIISSNGKSVVTESGSHSWLGGGPEAAWREWCIEKGYEVNPDDPFKGLKFGLTQKNA